MSDAPSDAGSHPTQIFSRRFSVKQIMAQTAVASLFCAALVQENEWWLATLVTVTMGVIFYQLLLAVFGVGVYRAFAIGHTLSAMLVPFSLYAQQLTLPFLLTREFLRFMQNFRSVDEGNFAIVAFIFWLHLSCRSAGYTAAYLYIQRTKAPLHEKRSPPVPIAEGR